MDHKGYNQLLTIMHRLERGPYSAVAVDIIPEPHAGQSVRWVTIVGRGGKLAPSLVLNALGAAGLIERPGCSPQAGGLYLRPFSAELGAVTLEDLAAPPHPTPPRLLQA